MPRNDAGVFTLVDGYQAVTGETIETSQHNPPLEDIASALTGSLPRNGSAGMLANLNLAGFRITNSAPAASSGDLTTKGQMDAAIAAAIAGVVAQIVTIPPGTMAYTAAGNIPSGWLEANGAAISRTTYAALFAAIGTRYGGGDGSTTFNLPDPRGEFIRCYDNGRGIDPGRTLGSFQGQDFQSHNHALSDPGHSHSLQVGSATSPGGNAVVGLVGSQFGFSANGSFTGISISPAGGAETRPRNLAYWAMIKI